MDIFQGVVGWVTVSGVPVSPTPANAASVTVAGDHVDFYQFKLDASAWSAERPASQPILLSGLGEGWHTLAVLGRSRYGGYLSASNAVLATWRVDATAPATLIAGVPATPSRQNTATLLVSSPNASLYRWTVDRGYYRAEAGLANPITLGALSSMPHVVAVIVKTNNTWQSQSNATEVAWTVDRSCRPISSCHQHPRIQSRPAPTTRWHPGRCPARFSSWPAERSSLCDSAKNPPT